MKALFMVSQGNVEGSLEFGISDSSEPLRIQDIWGIQKYEPESALTMTELGLRAKEIASEFCTEFQGQLKDISVEFMGDVVPDIEVKWYGADEPRKQGWTIHIVHPDAGSSCTAYFAFSEVSPSAQREGPLSLMSHTDAYSYKGATANWYLNRETGEIPYREEPTAGLEIQPSLETTNMAMKAMLFVSERLGLKEGLPTVKIAVRRFQDPKLVLSRALNLWSRNL